MSNIAFEFSDDDLDLLAGRLADRILAKLEPRSHDAGWLTTKQAAEHLGVSVDALHKLTAARSVPFQQDRPRARCYFKRSDLDAWRRRA